MSEDNKNLDQKVDELEAAAKKYASKDTVISIGGYEFTPAKLMVAFTIVSSTLGALYGAFEVYKDYQSMKKRIAEYVAPDLSEFDKRLAVITKQAEQAEAYTNSIKNDLKGDIRRLEGTVESVERNSKTTERELSVEMRTLRKETEIAIKDTNANVDKKIQRALDNPLANGK